MKKSVIASLVLVATLACVPAYSQQTPTGEFNLSTAINDDGTLTPTLSWSTTPAATSCVASGDDEWTGNKPAAGEVTLSPRPTTQPRNFMLVCTFPGDTRATLTWTPPTENTDGSPLLNLAGYRIHWGVADDQLLNTAQVSDPSVNTYTIENLPPGTWYFGVTAYTTQGAESTMSNIVSKTTRAPVEWSQSIGIKTPRAPVLGEVE